MQEKRPAPDRDWDFSEVDLSSDSDRDFSERVNAPIRQIVEGLWIVLGVVDGVAAGVRVVLPQKYMYE